jgi:hypothetical protein
MTKAKWYIFSALLLICSALVQLFKLIYYFNKDLIDGLSATFLGVGMAILLVTLFKKKSQ